MNESNTLLRPSGSTIPSSASDAEVLAGILQASTDACWCMEFGEPVDLSAPEQEIVRQVFENDPYWRFTNPAMARLYLLDSKEEFEARATSEIFPRNAQNESFILNLIANGFEVDAAPALDTRYDGVEIYVENDVRAHIENGKLLRMFGIVRDVGKQRFRQGQVQAELDATRSILEALPQPIIAFDANGAITAANAAAEQILGQDVPSILGLNAAALGLSVSIADGLRRSIERGLPTDVSAHGHVWSIVPMRTGGAIVTASDAEMNQVMAL